MLFVSERLLVSTGGRRRCVVGCVQLYQVVGCADPLLFCHNSGLALHVVFLVPEDHRLVS